MEMSATRYLGLGLAVEILMRLTGQRRACLMVVVVVVVAIETEMEIVEGTLGF